MYSVFTTFDHFELACFDLGDEWNVPGEDTGFAGLSGQYDLIGLGGEDLFVGRNEFLIGEFERRARFNVEHEGERFEVIQS